eukprot:m.341648 g.341648  ORF g.341648 m.341648 type:complete len:504 (+) comp20294_c0_seq1:118-1629(+)
MKSILDTMGVVRKCFSVSGRPVRFAVFFGTVLIFTTMFHHKNAKPVHHDLSKFRKLIQQISDQTPGQSLYRKAKPLLQCDQYNAPVQPHSYNKDAEAMLTPPISKISTWVPPSNEKEVRRKHQERAHMLLKPWMQSGIQRKNMPKPDPNDRTDCEEPLVIKYKDGQLYASFPTHAASPIAGYDPTKVSFMNPRRKHSIEAIRNATLANLKAGIKMPDFELVACHGDGYLPTDDTVSFGLAWGGEGTGTLPMSEQEWNWPGHAAWHADLLKTLKNREGHPWASRKEQVIFRGGIRDRACFPIKEKGGDESGVENAEYAGESCGRERLLQTSRCFPYILDAMPTDDKKNYMSMAEQENYKYVIYVEGNYGWANRLKTLLAMENVIIMQESKGGKEWYALDLIPWVHYIPVDHLFNNLPEVIAWAITNDEKVHKISQNADNYAKSILSMPAFAQHLETLVAEYAKLIRFPVELDPGKDLPVDALLYGFNDWMQYLDVVKKVVVAYT